MVGDTGVGAARSFLGSLTNTHPPTHSSTLSHSLPPHLPPQAPSPSLFPAHARTYAEEIGREGGEGRREEWSARARICSYKMRAEDHITAIGHTQEQTKRNYQFQQRRRMNRVHPVKAWPIPGLANSLKCSRRYERPAEREEKSMNQRANRI